MALIRSSPARMRQPSRKPPRRRITPRWAWWVPFWVFLFVLFMPFFVTTGVAAILGVFVIIAVGRRPERALMALLAVIPFHQAIFSGMYALGVPIEIVKPLGQWKELLIAGILIAGMRKAMKERHALDRLDAVALGYVGLGTAYLLLPGVFVGSALGSSLDLSTRLLGWRTDVMYVGLFLAARHLRLDVEARRRVTRAFLISATVVCAITYFEYTFQNLWDTIWLDWLKIAQYRIDVLRVTGDPNVFIVKNYTNVGGHQLLRAGSVLLYAFALGFYGCIAAAVLADRIVRGVARRIDYAALAIVCGAVLLTLIRSAVFALVVVLVLTVLRRPDRSPRVTRSDAARVRFTLLLAGISVFLVPLAASLGVVDRFQGKDDYSSNDAHRDSFNEGYDLLLTQPLGRGLSTSAGAGQRANVQGLVVTETQLLQIGTQLGALGLALWLGVVISAVLALGGADRRAPPDVDHDLLAGARTALIGLFAGGLFLQVYIDFTVSWSVWILAGLALGTAEHATDLADANRPRTPVESVRSPRS